MGLVLVKRSVDARSGGYGITYTDRVPSSNTPASRPSFLGEARGSPDSFSLFHKPKQLVAERFGTYGIMRGQRTPFKLQCWPAVYTQHHLAMHFSPVITRSPHTYGRAQAPQLNAGA